MTTSRPATLARVVFGCRPTHHRLGALRHVGVDMAPGRGFRDPVAAAYTRARIDRAVAMTVPTFAAAAAVVAATDLVATLPASLVEARGSRLALRNVEGPVPAHSVTMALCWHERTHADPPMIEFRSLVRRAILGGTTPAPLAGAPPRQQRKASGP